MMKVMDGTLDSTNKLIVTAAGAASVNHAQVAGATVATAASGIQKVGVTDGTGNAITSTAGHLDVNIASGGGAGFSAVDEAAWTAATSAFAPIGGVFNDSATALTTGQEGTARVTTNRGLHVNLRTAAGAEIGTSGSPVRVDVTGTTTQPVSIAATVVVSNAGTFAVQDSQKLLDNAAFTDGTTPVQPVGFILDEVAGTALTENDAAAARIDSKRAQVLVLEDATTRGQRASVSAANALKVDPSAVTSPVSIAGTVAVSVAPPTTGGYSVSRLLSAATTNATSVKASAGQVFGWYLRNAAAYDVFLKLYNKASAPTVGTDTPFMTIPIPTLAAANVEIANGVAFGTGIAFAITKVVTDADATAVALNDLVVNLFWK